MANPWAGILSVISLATCASVSADDPREVAEAALVAWRAGDATALSPIVHPELKKRMRTSRLLAFVAEQDHFDLSQYERMTDDEVVAAFCAALRRIVPVDDRFVFFDRFLRVQQRGELMIVSFDSGARQRSDPSHERSDEREVVLKKHDGEWRFLWFPGAMIHVDLMWDPRREEQAEQGVPDNLVSAPRTREASP